MSDDHPFDPQPGELDPGAVIDGPGARELAGTPDDLAMEPGSSSLGAVLPPPASMEPALDAAVDAPAPYVFDCDPSSWTQDQMPQEWTPWEPPPDATSEADWGTVQPEWSAQDEPVWPVTNPQPPAPVSTLIGPGHEADAYWGYQGDSNYCAFYSAASVLGEIYGQPLSDAQVQEMVDRAIANGWTTVGPDGDITGVAAEYTDELLSSYMVPSHTWAATDETALQDLNTALANNQRVIIGLDAAEIYGLEPSVSPDDPYSRPHAVAVTGVDYARGVVIVNDSAQTYGAGLEIPIGVLLEAWRDDGFYITVTDMSLPPGDGGQPPVAMQPPSAAAGGAAYTVLPVTLHAPAAEAPQLPEPAFGTPEN